MELMLLCIKVFCVRILDVSLGTFRTLLTVKGKTTYASVTGFFEILIWFLVVQEALTTDESSLWIAIAYAGGFAAGTFLGGKISQKFIKGNLAVQVVSNEKNKVMIDLLRKEGFAVSVIDVTGHDEEDVKFMLFIEIDNNQLHRLEYLVKSVDPKAFIVVNETKMVVNGYFK